MAVIREIDLTSIRRNSTSMRKSGVVEVYNGSFYD